MSVDLDGWRERLTSDKEMPTSSTVDDNTSDESDSEEEEPVAMDAALGKTLN